MNAIATNEPARIVRIIAVRDTRDVIEDGDRFVPVPGTGAIRACDRCGRDHEIHVDVELTDGRTSVIGLGCARGESIEVQARIKSAASAAKTRAKLVAELAAARGQHMRAAIAWREVEALELPAIELEVTPEGSPLGAGAHRGRSPAICHFMALRGVPTPKLGDVCPCCNGSGCHPRSAAGPINPNQDRIERWAPACVTCKGNGAINIESEAVIAERDRKAAKKLHWFEQCAPAVLELDLSQSTEVLQRAIRATYTARRFPFMWWQLEADEQSGKVYSGGDSRPGDKDRVVGTLVHKSAKAAR